MSGSWWLFIIVAYLSGSIPFGKFAGLYYKVDVQKRGSGNIGFANVVRTIGWKAGVYVLIGDVLKGFLPVYLARYHLVGNELLLVGMAAVLGHVFPVWLKFNGGKGIATGLGVTLALNSFLGLLAVLVYIAVFGFAKKSAISSLIAAWSTPLLCLFVVPRYWWFYLAMALFVTWTHRNNLKQLRRVNYV